MTLHRSNGTSLIRRLHEKAGAPPHAVAHHRRGISLQFARLRAAGLGGFAAFLAVLGPGLLACLSDDDPAGITTYSILGADHGYQLLWIIPASTVLLVQFHLMAVRVGAATGKGLVGAVRARWGHRSGHLAVAGLLLANFGTICAEYAGISAACSLIGIPSWLSVPLAAVLLSLISVLTGVVGLAIAVACAATLHRAGVRIDDAGDAAIALRPLAGSFATVLLGAGLLGASLLAAAIVPLATAYSIADGAGSPASLDLDPHHFQLFYVAFVGLTLAAAGVVSLPGLPLIPLIYSSQVVNAVMLPLHVVALHLLARDPAIMADARSGTATLITGWASIALILACVGALAWSWIGASAPFL